jgi:hypothetical protein
MEGQGQEGGKLLDKGVYGCIFQPPLACRKRKGAAARAAAPAKGGPRKLGKLTFSWSVEQEMAVANYFHGNPDAGRYMILPELDTLCAPKPIENQKEKDLSRCSPIDTFGYEDMMQYEMRHGGKAMYNMIEEARGHIPFFRIMRQLLEIGAFCTLHGLVHNDLHAGNVLMDKNYNPVLIDFGRSFFGEKLTKAMIEELKAEYAPDLDQCPPESSIEDGLDLGYDLEFIFEDLRTKKPSMIYAERYLGLNRSSQIRELRECWRTSKSMQRGDWLAFWKVYWPASDSWGMGTLLLWILRKLLFNKEFTESRQWIERGDIVRSVLRGMLHASPRKRMDCVEALALYDPGNDLVLGDKGIAWLDAKSAAGHRLCFRCFRVR